MPPFSERQGFLRRKSIQYRDELPNVLRRPIIDLALRRTNSTALLRIVTGVLDPYGIDPTPLQLVTASRPFSLSSGDADLDSVRRAIDECHWFRVYDVVESIYRYLASLIAKANAPQFESEINEYFAYAEIGWQLRDGVVKKRGDETFEFTLDTAVSALEKAEKPTAVRHLQFAISAFSTRPKPNTSGAVAHATSAVECVLGEITGETMTLGKYLDKNPRLFHPALRKGLDGIFGYASDEGARHGKEGTEPAIEEAEFAIATCAAVCTLLIRKNPK
jgi:hypothetical protein